MPVMDSANGSIYAVFWVKVVTVGDCYICEVCVIDGFVMYNYVRPILIESVF